MMRKRKIKVQEPQSHTPQDNLHDISIMQDNDMIMQVFTTPIYKQTPVQLFDGWVKHQEETNTVQKYHSTLLQDRSQVDQVPMLDKKNSIKIQRYAKLGRSAVLLQVNDSGFIPKRSRSQQLSGFLKLHSSRELNPISFSSQHIFLKKRTGVTSAAGSYCRRQRPSVSAVSYPIFQKMIVNPEKRSNNISKVRQMMHSKRTQLM